MNKKIGVVIIILIGIVLTACSSSSAPKPLELTIEMSEFAFSPQNLGFQVGQKVTLHLKNVGALGHEIMFGKDVVLDDGQPHEYTTDMFAAAHIEPEVTMMEAAHEEGGESDEMHMEEEHSGFMVNVPTGDNEYTMKFTVTEDMVGQWEIGCFDQNGIHYNAGMVGTLTVSP